MAKSKAFRAAIARRKAARVKVKHTYKPVLRPSKDRDAIRASMTHCCIPAGSIDDNPNVTIKEIDGWNLDMLKPYREVKAKWEKWDKEHFRSKIKRKEPWYMMHTDKCYNYQESDMGDGKKTTYERVHSEAYVFTSMHTIPRMTPEKYRALLIEAKLKDWEKKHPRPIKHDDQQPDLFEAQFDLPWIKEHTDAREKITQFVNQIGNRAHVFARYIGDSGYPHKIAEVKSDHKPFMIMDGKYTNYDSHTINEVQKMANHIHKQNNKLVALKVVEGEKECIIVPHIPIEQRLAA